MGSEKLLVRQMLNRIASATVAPWSEVWSRPGLLPGFCDMRGLCVRKRQGSLNTMKRAGILRKARHALDEVPASTAEGTRLAIQPRIHAFNGPALQEK